MTKLHERCAKCRVLKVKNTKRLCRSCAMGIAQNTPSKVIERAASRKDVYSRKRGPAGSEIVTQQPSLPRIKWLERPMPC